MYTFFVFADSGLGALFSGLGINTAAFISQVISFGIVFIVLQRYGFPLILNILEKRQATIREGIENAEQAKRNLAEANTTKEQIIVDARRQAQEIIAKAEQAAEREAARIAEEAKVAADRLRQQQIASIQQEAARTRAELGRAVINLSISAAGKVINKSVDTNDNRRLVEDFVTASQTEGQ